MKRSSISVCVFRFAFLLQIVSRERKRKRENMADAEYARLESMTVVQLRAELKRRGCSTSGNKKDLLAKLRLALQNAPDIVEQVK